jgi:hypothetical protein
MVVLYLNTHLESTIYLPSHSLRQLVRQPGSLGFPIIATGTVFSTTIIHAALSRIADEMTLGLVLVPLVLVLLLSCATCNSYCHLPAFVSSSTPSIEGKTQQSFYNITLANKTPRMLLSF